MGATAKAVCVRQSVPGQRQQKCLGARNSWMCRIRIRQGRKFQLVNYFGGDCSGGLSNADGERISRLLQVSELAGENRVRSIVTATRLEALGNQLRIAFEINKMNVSGAKLFAIGMFEGGAG